MLPLLLSSPHTNAATASVASRLLLSLLLHLPQLPPSLVSSDPSLRNQILEKVIWACEITILYDASNPWLRRGLGLFAQMIGQPGDAGGPQDVQAIRALSLLIHPHLPPNVRSISSLDSVSLYRIEGKDEREAREGLGLVSLDDRDEPRPSLNHTQAPSLNQPYHSDLAPIVHDVHMTSAEPVQPPASVQYPPPSSYAPTPSAPTPQTTSTTSFTPSWASNTPNTKSTFSSTTPQATASTAFLTTPLVSEGPNTYDINGSTSTPSASSVPKSDAHPANQEFVPLGVGSEDEESDDDDAPIPEIDMRSDSEEEE